MNEGIHRKQLFESEHISFVEVSEDLIQDYLVMVNDYENVNRYIGGLQKTFTEEQEADWVRKKQEEKATVFSMIEKKSGEYIGNIELMDRTDYSGELGIALTAKKQDMGYGTEAILALIDYGFDQLGLQRIYLRTNPDNARAIRVYQKCGFQEYGCNEKHVYMEQMKPDESSQEEHLHEPENDNAYAVISQYDPEGVQYFLMTDDLPYQGLDSHREAIRFAMQKASDLMIRDIKEAEVKLEKTYADAMRPISFDIGKAEAKPIDAKDLLYVPVLLKKDRLNNTFYDCDYKNENNGGAIPYWYAFLEVPHESGRFDPSDFEKVNHSLFPEGTDQLEAYEWTTDWSEYFVDGHEWWGASCWSVYDKKKNRYVVILASATD